MELVQNRWYAVLTPDEVPRRKAVAHRRLGLELVFWRDGDGQLACAVDRCPHRGAALSPGRIREGCIECPFHGFRFERSGACTKIPAHPERRISGAMSLASIPAREEHGLVWLWTGPEPAPEGPVPFFDFTGWSFAGSAFTEPVATHYTRSIENQLDFPHLPFVHRTTIGNFVGEEMEVHTETDGDLIRCGLEPDNLFIEFRGPNIWRNKTGAVWQFLAMVPIDETHMKYYIRTYQQMLRVPGLDWVVGKANAALNGVVLRQDTAVVESQPAVETRLRMGEVLIPGDGPIIAYRRWREQHRAPFEPGRSERLPDPA